MYLNLLNHTIFISLHSGPKNVWNSFSLLSYGRYFHRGAGYHASVYNSVDRLQASVVVFAAYVDFAEQFVLWNENGLLFYSSIK